VSVKQSGSRPSCAPNNAVRRSRTIVKRRLSYRRHDQAREGPTDSIRLEHACWNSMRLLRADDRGPAHGEKLSRCPLGKDTNRLRRSRVRGPSPWAGLGSGMRVCLQAIRRQLLKTRTDSQHGVADSGAVNRLRRALELQKRDISSRLPKDSPLVDF
jgi:hypothetical protein